MKPLPKSAHTLIIIFLCYITRLPQLISPYLILDGDECVLALMAKYMYLGKGIPVFFWGQNYGFSLVETVIILPFYALLGISAISVKLAMLSLWMIGVVFFYKTLTCINEKYNTLPFLLILLFISAPAWAEWSMKARGGYLTSFTLSCVCMYLLFNAAYYKKTWPYLLLSVLVNFIYLSQPFWLAGILPLVCYRLIKEHGMIKVAVFTLSLSAQVFLFHLYKATVENTFEPPLFMPDSHFFGPHIARLPAYLYNSFHGWHYFSIIHTPNAVSAIWAVALCVITLLLVATGLFFLLKKRDPLLVCSVIFIPVCMGYTVFSYSMEVRYLLPVTGFVILSLQILFSHLKYTRWAQGGLIGLILIGFVAVATFWHFRFLKTTKEGLLQTIAYLEQNDIHYTYSTHDMLSWQVMFYSNEKIISRGFPKPGRSANYTSIVDNAYNSGKKVALIGFRGEFYNQPEDAWNKDMNGLFVRLNPMRQDLVKDFQF